jgi:hypothetical protein
MRDFSARVGNNTSIYGWCDSQPFFLGGVILHHLSVSGRYDTVSLMGIGTMDVGKREVMMVI